MKTTIDRAGRLVIPRSVRERIGLAHGGEVELDGGAVRVAPVAGKLHDAGGFLVILRSGTRVTADDVRELIDADRHRV